MKKISIALLAVSFSAFAGNPEMDAIFKKYESSLMNFKVGMKSVSNNLQTDLETAENGTTTSKLSQKYVTSVLLKVDGTKIYEYEVTKDISSGEESVLVSLTDKKIEYTDEIDFTDIKVVNNVLSASYSEDFTNEQSIYSIKGSVTKNLLSSIFCDSTIVSDGIYKDLTTGLVYPLKNNQINKCNGVMPVSDIKKIDLTEIEFCDYTLPDDSDEICETKDMSFLTTEL